ncbi:hypothetical protein [Pseudomonas phage PP21]
MEHVNIPDDQRHEAKGASTAALNTVLHSDGDGTTSFKFVDYANISNVPVIDGYEFVLSSFSGASQLPASVDVPLQVTFGSAQTTADVSLASNGTVTFNTAGNYIVTFILRFGRAGGTGNCVLLNRIKLNGLQAFNTNTCSFDNAFITVPFSATLGFNVTAGTTMTMEIMRDSSGNNSGGLIATTPVQASWNISPSATIIVSKFSGS